MPAPKLTPELKQQILSLYCETDASTNELASQFAVSASTVLRLLKESLSTEDYQKSVKQKQVKHKRSLDQALDDQIQPEFLVQIEDQLPESSQSNYPQKSLKSKNKQKGKELPQKLKQVENPTIAQSNQLKSDQLDLMAAFVAVGSTNKGEDQIFNAFPSINDLDQNCSDNFQNNPLTDISEQPSQVLPEGIRVSAIASPTSSADRLIPKKVIKSLEPIKELTKSRPSQKFDEQEEEILDEVSDHFDDQDDEFEHLDDVSEEDEDSDDQAEDFPVDSSINGVGNEDGEALTEVRIYALEDADLPSTCYMVVDKSSEMITRPLRDFSEIGKIPADEQSRATLLIFSNHRVAKRFSRQNQRVIKFSGELLYITQQKLAAKGITRLLFEGRVYAL